MNYLDTILECQRISQDQQIVLNEIRGGIESELNEKLRLKPRFYYGGSYAKQTMVKASYDLDLIVYFSSNTPCSPQTIYETVERILSYKGYTVQRKNVALRLSYNNNFHVDIVPGKARDEEYIYANLYPSAMRNTSKQTSLKHHIDIVRKNSVYKPVIKLLKLWKLHHNLPISSFMLELLTHKSLFQYKGTLEDSFLEALRFMANNLTNIRLIDPANSNNIVSNEMSNLLKRKIQDIALVSFNSRNFEDIIPLYYMN